MSSWNPDNCLSDSDSEDEEVLRQYTGREAILFVLDAHLNAESDRLKWALELIRSAFLSGLVTNDKDLLGIIFDSTKNAPLPLEKDCLNDILVPKHCAVFLPPRQLTKGTAQHFLSFLDTFTKESFDEQYGCHYDTEDDGSGSFISMLRLCKDLIRHCNYNVDNSTIIYFTDRTTPYKPTNDEYHRAIYKATDLRDDDIDFQIIPMIDDFDYDTFYREFLSLVWGESLESFVPIAPQKLRDIMADRKIKQKFHTRSLGHFKFYLGPDVAISAMYFSYFQKSNDPHKILLQRTDNSIVRRKIQYIIQKENKLTGELEERRMVNVTDAWYEIVIGNEVIRFSNEQVNRIRNLHAPGMMLLGFKSSNDLKDVLHVKPCNFMYPDNTHIMGSKKLFRALWERCRARRMVPICLFMCKRKAKPCYVALVPVSRSDVDQNSHYSLIANDGFKIVYLPFASNIRRVNFSEWNTMSNHASDEAVALCEKIVRKFRLVYHHSIFSDPNLNRLTVRLLALAFNVKFGMFGSNYYPNPEAQDGLLENVIEQFKTTFSITDTVEVTKRKKATISRRGTKKLKASENNDDDDE